MFFQISSIFFIFYILKSKTVDVCFVLVFLLHKNRLLLSFLSVQNMDM